MSAVSPLRVCSQWQALSTPAHRAAVSRCIARRQCSKSSTWRAGSSNSCVEALRLRGGGCRDELCRWALTGMLAGRLKIPHWTSTGESAYGQESWDVRYRGESAQEADDRLPLECRKPAECSSLTISYVPFFAISKSCQECHMQILCSYHALASPRASTTAQTILAVAMVIAAGTVAFCKSPVWPQENSHMNANQIDGAELSSM